MGRGVAQVRIGVEDGLRAVAVVHVPVQDRDPPGEAGGAQRHRRQGDVVRGGRSRRRARDGHGGPADERRRRRPSPRRPAAAVAAWIVAPAASRAATIEVGADVRVCVDPAATLRGRVVEQREVPSRVDPLQRGLVGGLDRRSLEGRSRRRGRVGDPGLDRATGAPAARGGQADGGPPWPGRSGAGRDARRSSA